MAEIDYGRLDALEYALGGRPAITAAYIARTPLLGTDTDATDTDATDTDATDTDTDAEAPSAPLVESVNVVAVSGAAQTIANPSVEAENEITLTEVCTLTFPAVVAGTAFTLALIQDGTGSRTVVWPTVKWSGGTAPTLTTTAGKVDLFSFIVVNGNWVGTTAGLNF